MNLHLTWASTLLFTGVTAGGPGDTKASTEDPYSGLLTIKLADDITAKIGGRLFATERAIQI